MKMLAGCVVFRARGSVGFVDAAEKWKKKPGERYGL
jgi:hypothetical protein